MEKTTGHPVLLCVRDASVAEAVEVSAATVGVPLQVVSDSDEARAAWPSAPLRLVSTEVAARWSTVAPGWACLVGKDPKELARCSAELGLPVLPLPDQTGRLAEALARSRQVGLRRGATVALLGASGGLGVSTLTTALALLAARRGNATVAVDLAEGSGGLDLLVGLETAPGLRWADLLHARGEADAILPGLPSTEGAAFLAPSRDAQQRPGKAATDAVLGSLAKSAQLVVVDGGRHPVPGCDQTLVVVGADVRSVAAARVTVGLHVPTGIVVRTGPGRSLPPETVAASLGAPCLGVIGQENQLPRLAELGMSPVAVPARRYRRQVDALLERLANG